MNTLLPLKALCYFDDGYLGTLSQEIKDRLLAAVAVVGEIPEVVAQSPRLGGVKQ